MLTTTHLAEGIKCTANLPTGPTVSSLDVCQQETRLEAESIKEHPTVTIGMTIRRNSLPILFNLNQRSQNSYEWDNILEPFINQNPDQRTDLFDVDTGNYKIPPVEIGQQREEYKKSKKEECGKKDEDEIKNLCMEMLKEIKAIKINQEKTNEEMKEIRLEITQMNKKWENKCKKLEKRVDGLERKIEILEKEKSRKNLVIKGLEVCGDKEEVQNQVQHFLKDKMGVDKKIEEAMEIKKGIILIKLGSLEEKLEILKNKKRIRPNGRILGGEDAKIGDHSYQLSFQIYEIHFCGASLLSDTKAVTAAHCTDNFPVDTFSVHAGSNTVDKDGELVNVLRLAQHPQFNPDYTDYDVSVLTLSKSLTLGSSIGVVPLQTVDEEPAVGSKAVATGWGEIDDHENFPSQLQKVDLKYSSSGCIYRSLSEQNGCFVAESGKGVCWGDSGGPIVSEGKLVGIVSWGDACTLPEYTLIHTSIWNSEIHNFVSCQFT
ncbi:hypothetical protein FQR65_LT18462 [Abscondita terminalis]|nr:hypothetical protein FQR65_LT18462 [Abscondita terminalis]